MLWYLASHRPQIMFSNVVNPWSKVTVSDRPFLATKHGTTIRHKVIIDFTELCYECLLQFSCFAFLLIFGPGTNCKHIENILQHFHRYVIAWLSQCRIRVLFFSKYHNVCRLGNRLVTSVQYRDRSFWVYLNKPIWLFVQVNVQ